MERQARTDISSNFGLHAPCTDLTVKLKFPMRADRHPILRRLRVLLTCAVVLWGAGMAVPPALAEAIPIHAPRASAVPRLDQARPVRRLSAAPISPKPSAWIVVRKRVLPTAPDLG